MELSQPETQSRAFKPAPQQLADVPIMRVEMGTGMVSHGDCWNWRKLVAVKAWLPKMRCQRIGGSSWMINLLLHD